MVNLAALPMGLAPHHDGSSLYVPNQAPKLLDKVKVRVRVHQALGKVKEVRVRFSESGEAFPTPPAKVIGRDGLWSWYESTIVMHNPKMNYRFMIVLETGETVWYNTQGLSLRNPADILDFRINTFSSAPKWGKDAVMYQIFPDRFARSSKADKHKAPDWAVPQKWADPVMVEGRNRSQQFYGGDLWGVIEKLDHLKKLGINLVYLTPMFPARSNHRYDASSFDQIDPLVGGNKAFEELIKAAHKKGMRVIGDLTTNHSGDAHEWFKASFGNPKAAESEFYYFSEKNSKYDAWFGVKSLPKFNWKSSELRKRFIAGKRSVVAKWLKAPYNMDGWRIDVANMTGRIRDEDMYLDVAQTVRQTMVDVNPNTIMLGEYTGDAAYEVQGDGWQGAMTYSNFTKPVWRWFYNTKTQAQRAKDHPNFEYAGFMMWDGAQTGTGRDLVASYNQFIAAFPWHVRLCNMNPLDTHDIPRFKTYAIDGAQKVAAAMQFTFPGIPVVWAGDEFGLDGYNGEHARTPLPWNGELPTDPTLIGTYAALAKLRRENSALTEGSLRWVYASDEAVVYVRENAKQSVVVAVTRGADKKIVLAKDAVPGLARAKNIYGGGRITKVGDGLALPGEKLSVNVWCIEA
jgi:alpha-glucosidase